MPTSHNENDPFQQVSPVSAQSPQTHPSSIISRDRDADAPEAVDAAMTPSTFVASPATDYGYAGGTDEGAKEAFTYDKSDKIAVPTAYEYQTSPYPQVVGGQDIGPKPEADPERSVGASAALSAQEPRSKILGLKKRTFYILLLIAACVVIAAAVGGGVGGALGSKKSTSTGRTTDPAATNPPASSSTPSSTRADATTSSSTSSAPSAATATFLNQTSTSSGHFFQGFSETNMAGAYTRIVSEIDGADFAFDVRSYQYIAQNTNCCLSFCTNATREGWLGYVCESRKQNAAADAFSRVFVWCSDKRTDAVARGRCA
ncbi:hypothetical protein BBO_07700 [Beauveria brongniartii RCEF 3172]|uniref:Uncharacterized protein n=1 Tax=Beauveria brongniartii RCEF 3172 TaxID=1081107 RepID=A0A166YWK3_9HYPO|nr:hypothetical protein BBO_07700 [Beauveria brongniartii RCEF 3172]